MSCFRVAPQIFPRLLPLVFVLLPGAFQKLHLNVVVGSALLSSPP